MHINMILNLTEALFNRPQGANNEQESYLKMDENEEEGEKDASTSVKIV